MYWKSYKYNDICLDWSPMHTLSVNNMDNFIFFRHCYLHSDYIYQNLNLCLWSQIITSYGALFSVLRRLIWTILQLLHISLPFFSSWLSVLKNYELALWPLSSSSLIVLQFKAIALNTILLWVLYSFFIGLVSSLLLMTKS